MLSKKNALIHIKIDDETMEELRAMAGENYRTISAQAYKIIRDYIQAQKAHGVK